VAGDTEWTPAGATGDVAVFCFYKSFGLPEGAAVLHRRRPPRSGLTRDSDCWSSAAATAGIAAVDLRALTHPAIAVDRFPRAARRRARTLGVPVHHELRARDITRIARSAAVAVGCP
jgi:hypothetical protein